MNGKEPHIKKRTLMFSFMKKILIITLISL
jgi:hypothetical protein